MRIAVLADVHGNLPALEAVLSHLDGQGGCDQIWVLGDLAVFCPYPADVLERLAALPEARFLQGNTDRYLVTGRRPAHTVANSEDEWARIRQSLEEREANFRWTMSQLSFGWYSFLRGLPFEQRFDVPGYGLVLAVHGSPHSDEIGVWADTSDDDLREMLSGSDSRLLLCGHTHRPLDRSLGDVRVINVGSVGLPLDGDRRAAYVRVDLEDTGECRVALHRVEYDVDEVVARLEEVAHLGSGWVESTLRMAASPT